MALDAPRWVGGSDAESRLGAAAETLGGIEAWATSPALARLVQSFGGELPSLPLRGLLAWLDDFSERQWDFRKGRERNLASDAVLTPRQCDRALHSALELGLRPSLPRSDHYDVALLTGGMVRAGVVKPRYAAELRARGVDIDSVVFLGAFRPFAGDESATALALGISGTDEVDAMEQGLVRQFGRADKAVVREGSSAHPLGRWRHSTWQGAGGGPRLGVVAAPSSEPLARRANTVDTLEFWAERIRQPHETSVLVITTPSYVPYQAACAVQVLGLGHNLAVETVGVSDTAADLGELSQRFEPQHHLQEIRSAIRGYRALVGSVDATADVRGSA
ncbi:hypothetical protein [Homoserinimonas hongtaonis]|uniref:hypothetical protein n=1 Tax=Homoserinimonas hongtaonis TaxID=2079791 RepID=UPI000D3864CE|nr:hypothetical protein [Salinibacterium hongtaonis]AWB89448.1 hypothetical protein C2138_07770 [Salinibacterium hongtaonis]